MEDLISVLPFGGTFDLVQLKGSTLRKAFEHSVKRYGQSTGEFLQVSGIFILPSLSSYYSTQDPTQALTSLILVDFSDVSNRYPRGV